MGSEGRRSTGRAASASVSPSTSSATPARIPSLTSPRKHVRKNVDRTQDPLRGQRPAAPPGRAGGGEEVRQEHVLARAWRYREAAPGLRQRQRREPQLLRARRVVRARPHFPREERPLRRARPRPLREGSEAGAGQGRGRARGGRCYLLRLDDRDLDALYRLEAALPPRALGAHAAGPDLGSRLLGGGRPPPPRRPTPPPPPR